MNWHEMVVVRYFIKKKKKKKKKKETKANKVDTKNIFLKCNIFNQGKNHIDFFKCLTNQSQN